MMITTLYTDGLEIDVDVEYTFVKGYAGDQIDPPQPDTIEINNIRAHNHVAIDLEDWYVDESLIKECLTDYYRMCEDAAHDAADARYNEWKLRDDQ